MTTPGDDGASYKLTPQQWAENYWTVIVRQLETQERDQIKAGNWDAAEGARLVRQAVEEARRK